MAGAQALRDGFGIHPGEHQHLTGVVLLGDGGDEAVLVEFQGVDEGCHKSYLECRFFEKKRRKKLLRFGPEVVPPWEAQASHGGTTSGPNNGGLGQSPGLT